MDNLILTVDRFTRQLGPVNVLVDRLVDRLVPKAEAQACGGTCFYGCTSGVCYTGPCENGQQKVVRITMHGRWDVPGCMPQCGECNHDSCYTYQSC